MSKETLPPTIRSLGLAIYVPTFIFAMGSGAVLPIVALSAKDLGASVALAGLTVAVRGIGGMVFDIPAGTLVARFGERRALLMATFMLLVSLIGCVASPDPLVFLLFVFLMGCGWSVWLMARLAYITDVMPPTMRGRALSTLGGVQRIGNFVGPFIGALAISLVGLDGAYYVHIALALLGIALLYVVPEPHESTPPTGHPPVRALTIGRQHAHTFLTAGVGAIAISMLRAIRHVVLPLWADHIGLDAAVVGVMFGISAGVEMTLFYPAGLASDRLGRKVVAVPCLVTMAVGMLLVPLTHGFWTLTAVSVLVGIGNGLGAGILMTLGADFSPERARAEFLGVWRLVGDLGSSGGPLLLAGLVPLTSLAGASTTMGVLGLLAAAHILRSMPEPLHQIHSPVSDDDTGLVT